MNHRTRVYFQRSRSAIERPMSSYPTAEDGKEEEQSLFVSDSQPINCLVFFPASTDQ